MVSVHAGEQQLDAVGCARVLLAVSGFLVHVRGVGVAVGLGVGLACLVDGV